MRILVGLGNPGPEYRSTRHNVGFLVVGEIRRRHGEPAERRVARSLVSRVPVGVEGLLLARPQSYMNRSGPTVADLLERERADPGEMLVVCDDLNLELGTLRLRPRGSHGGHNGLRSIIEALGTGEFPRLRVGVGPADPGVEHAEFVLAPFARTERAGLEEVVRRAADCAESVAAEGLGIAMNRYNRRQAATAGR